MNSIAVVTFAQLKRKELLLNCMESVRNQLIDIELKHYIFYKDSSLIDYINDNYDSSEHNYIAIYYDDIDVSYTFMKMALLRNMAIEYINEDYVCFLDDDNEFNPVHLQSLVNLFSNDNIEAAHSWRYLVNDDDTLFDGSYYPWHNKKDNETKALIHSWCVDNKLIVPGSSVLRDRYIEDDSSLNISNVDMNEWLFLTAMLKQLKFDEEFSNSDQEQEYAEDYKLLLRLRSNNVKYLCSNLPTIKYRLGGFSNNLNKNKILIQQN